jgi:beta-mannosidase
MTRKEVKKYPDEDSAANYSIETDLQVWGTNSTLEAKNVTLEMTAFDLQSSEGWKHTWKVEAELLPNQSTELWRGLVPGQPIRNNVADVPKDIIVSARLLDGNCTVLARYANW